MTDGFGRRDFLKGAVAGGVAATAPTTVAEAQAQAQPGAAAATPGYAFLNLDEAAFVEALVDHMVPADDLTPNGTDIGINIYIDRALVRRVGQGRSALHAGPVEAGRAEPGLSTAAHAGAALSRRHRGDQRALPQDLRQDIRPPERASSARRCSSASRPRRSRSTAALPVRVFWSTLYQNVMEGMFSDPIYGGNRNKAGWKLIGFPGAIAVHRENIEKYKRQEVPRRSPLGIADMS